MKLININVTTRVDGTQEVTATWECSGMTGLEGFDLANALIAFRGPTESRVNPLDAVRVPAKPEPVAEVVSEAPSSKKAPKKPKAAPEPEPEEDEEEEEDEDEEEEEAPPQKKGGVKVKITDELRGLKFREVVAHLIELGIDSKKELIKQVKALVNEVPSITKMASKDDFESRITTAAEFINTDIKA